MADPYIGEIRMFGGSFAPLGWALCDGALLEVSTNQALYGLIGTTYGGDGVTNFALPNLQGRVPLHQSSQLPVGRAAGEESVTLTVNQLPTHSHPFTATKNAGSAGDPTGNVPAAYSGNNAYLRGAAQTALAPASITPDPGGSQPHPNMQPFLCVTFIISLSGDYPPHS
jgi:microcystin-dependent protein